MAIGQDKIEHYSFGFVFTLFALIDITFVFSGIVFALGKEVYDHVYGKGWNNGDIVSTCMGVMAGLGFLVIIL